MHAFIWQDGLIRDLGTLGTDSAAVINSLGHVVGWSQTTTGLHAFVCENGHMSDLGTIPECRSTAAVDINEHDQIVGAARRAPVERTPSCGHAATDHRVIP
jgi:probable HAF family extracellular repeat protein